MKKIIFFMCIFLMVSATALAFPKDENGYKDFYFGEDVNEVLSKYGAKSVKNADDGSVVYTIAYEDNSLEQYDILAVPDIQLEFKDGKLCSINRFFAAASPEYAALTFVKLANGISKSFGETHTIDGSKEDKIAYYTWRGNFSTVVLLVDLNPMDVPDSDIKLYRIFLTILPIK